MITETVLDAAAMDAAIANCALEPIHTPGATQSFGAAIVVDGSSRITHVSRSSDRVLGAPANVLLGVDVREAFTSQLAGAWARLSPLRPDQVANQRVILSGRELDLAVWRRPDGATVLSFLSAGEDAAVSPVEELGELQRALGATTSLQHLCDRAALLVREMSGYDRVMVYQFDDAGNGKVISEARREDMEPFLGLHYPASDIPAQARALYLRNRSRVLGDTEAVTDSLVAQDASLPDVDLSLCLLRAHSPVHVQYLRNMGIRATLVLSIVSTDGVLWGLVACHHLAPRIPSLRVRLLSDFVGPIIAVRLKLQEEADRRTAEALAAAAHHDLLRLLATAGSSWAEVIASPTAQPRLTELVLSSGAALLSDGIVRVVGATTPAEVIRSLAASLAPRLVAETFHASSVADVAGLALHEHVAAGVLAIRLRADRDVWLFWFRPAQSQQVTWAGEPVKTIEVAQGIARLSPRQSFAAWTEEQRGCAEPWTIADLACARRVRESLSDVLLQHYAHAARSAQLDLVRVRQAEATLVRAKDAAEAVSRELEVFSYSVAHDLRGPVRGMSGLAELLLGTYDEQLDVRGQGWLRRILLDAHKMAGLIDALLSLSRLTRSEMTRESIDLSLVVREVAARLADAEPGRSLVVQDDLRVDADPALVRALVENLLGNAWKFTSGVAAPRIEVGATEGEGSRTYFVRDNGAGFDMSSADKLFVPFQRLHSGEEFAGTGIGLATAQRIILRHGGRIWARGAVGNGATFYFTFAAEHPARP